MANIASATRTLTPLRDLPQSVTVATQELIKDQAMVNYSLATGPVRHTLLAGVEVRRQLTDNFRSTGFFSNTATSLSVPYASPTIDVPVTFRQSATDADNHVRTSVAATYVQDQLELSRAVQVIGGLRFDRFDLRYHWA